MTGTTDTMTTADCGTMVEFNNASGVAETGLSASGAGSGYAETLCSISAGAVTVTSGGGNFYSTGSTALTISGNACAAIQSDGSGWSVVSKPGGGSPGGSSGQIQTNNGSGGFAGVANISASQMPLNGGTFNSLAHPGYVASVYYAPLGSNNLVNGGGVMVSTTMYCTVGQVGLIGGGNASATLGQLGARITTAGPTSGVIGFAMYNDAVVAGIHRPGTLIDYSTGQADTSATTVTGAVQSTDHITPGFYWFCAATTDSANQTKIIGKIGSYSDITEMQYIGSLTASTITAGAANTTGGVSETACPVTVGAVSSTWPSQLTTCNSGSYPTWAEVGTTAPFVFFQFSSVP